MIPILFNSNETAFTSNGLGRLAEAVRCEVTEERNGQFELELQYPVSGEHFDEMQPGCYILATHDNNGDPQAFQIYQIDEPLNGIATIHAWHISYLLNGIIVRPFTATSCAQAIASIPTQSINENAFTFWTDKAVTGNFALTEPKNARSILAGSEGSILDVYGKGEFEFDMFTVKLYLNRGADRGVQIRYGKNLASLDRQLDASGVYVSAVPYWTDTDGNTVYYDGIVTRTGSTPGRAVPMDLSEDFEEQPTPAQLQARCQAKLDSSDAYEVKDNIKIDFVQLWQTEEYKDIANLERVFLCDTVHIIYKGITATAKCIKVVYDTLLERYVSMELGSPKRTLSQEIQQTIVDPAVAQLPSKSMLQSAIDNATALISGGFGGYIKFNYLSDGTPSEMLIMNAPTESAATNIIRLNQNGLGFSTDGGTTYRNAWTIDGQLNADFITTGNLIASVITTGLLQDATGKNYWNLDTGQFVTKQGQIGGFTIGDTELTNGDADGQYTSGSVISPTGIIYSNGSAWRVKLSYRYGMQIYDTATGEWVDGPGFGMTRPASGSGYTGNGAVVYADNLDIGASFQTFPWVTYDGVDYYNQINRNTYIIGQLYAQGLKLRDALPIAQGGTGQTSAPEALEALADGHIFLDKEVRSGSPLTLTIGGTNTNVYWGALVTGIVQNVGAICLAVKNDNGTITARDIVNNTRWTSTTLSFSVSGNRLTISSSQSGTSHVSVFIG